LFQTALSDRSLNDQPKQGLCNGVPFFVINGVPAFSGAQHPETFVAAFRQVLDMDEPKCGPDMCSV
jgi:predicted DsbA family dithiol-disulfide isomerase